MSIDFKIQNKCDHIINWERSSFETDRRTINLSYPVASVASLSLRINNVIKDKSEYSVYLNKSTLNLIPKSYILMRRVSLLNSPLVEIKYTTYESFCPKCAGRKYIDDIKYRPDKDISTVSDELLLIQTLEKHIVTQIRTNQYHPWIGTSLHDLVSSKITDLDLIRSRVQDDVRKAVNDVRNVQDQYVKTGRPVTLGELFGELLSVEVEKNGSEISTINVTVRFTAQSGRTLQYEQLLELAELRQR